MNLMDGLGLFTISQMQQLAKPHVIQKISDQIYNHGGLLLFTNKAAILQTHTWEKTLFSSMGFTSCVLAKIKSAILTCK